MEAQIEDIKKSRRNSVNLLESSRIVTSLSPKFAASKSSSDKFLSPGRISGIPVRSKTKSESEEDLESIKITNEYTEIDITLLEHESKPTKVSSEYEDVSKCTSIFELYDETKILAMLRTNPNLDREICETTGKTILHNACQHSFSPLVNYLLRRQVDMDIQDYDGMTPLHYCSSDKIVRLLWYDPYVLLNVLN